MTMKNLEKLACVWVSTVVTNISGEVASSTFSMQGDDHLKRWQQQTAVKHHWLCTNKHGMIFQKTSICTNRTLRTSNFATVYCMFVVAGLYKSCQLHISLSFTLCLHTRSWSSAWRGTLKALPRTLPTLLIETGLQLHQMRLILKCLICHVWLEVR